MRSLLFVVPVHGRLPLAAICLRQLRRTCDALLEHEIEASAIVVGDEPNLLELRERLDERLLGFGSISRDNRYLSRRFNDGIQLACDRRYNPRPAEYVVPCGSDDWVDWRLFVDLPGSRSIACFQALSFVREDGREIASSVADYLGGCGIRIYPRRILGALGFRPADEDRARGCDTSILTNLLRVHGRRLHVEHRESDPRQIVDWKSAGANVNTYRAVSKWARGREADPFEVLEGLFPEEALDEMAEHYSRTRRREAVAT